MSNLWVIPEELGDYADSEYAYEACKSASYLLWALSGRKFNNVNTITERYEPTYRSIDRTEYYIQSQIGVGSSSTTNIGTVSGKIPMRRLRLRGNPIQSIVSVQTFDGDIFDDDEFVLLDKTWLLFKSPVGVPIEITYTFGAEPPTMGRMAARSLAIEFAKLWAGDDDCELPDRVTSFTRQGITATVLDNQDFIDDLKTGVYQVDLFLKSVNPDKARVRPKVFTADSVRGRRTRPQDQAGGWGNGGWDMGGWDQ